MTDIAQETAGRRHAAAGARARRAVGWLRANLFSSVFNTILTLLAVELLAVTIPPLIRWALDRRDLERAQRRGLPTAAGACWAFIGEKMPLHPVRPLPLRPSIGGRSSSC